MLHLYTAGGLVTPVYDERVFMNEMRMSQVRDGGRRLGGSWSPRGLSYWHGAWFCVQRGCLCVYRTSRVVCSPATPASLPVPSCSRCTKMLQECSSVQGNLKVECTVLQRNTTSASQFFPQCDMHKAYAYNVTQTHACW